MWLPDGHFSTESFQKPRGGSAGLQVTWPFTGPPNVAVAASSGAPYFRGRLSGFGARDTTASKVAEVYTEVAAYSPAGDSDAVACRVAYVGCFTPVVF